MKPKRKVGNPNLGEIGKPYRFKKGQSGNPKGRPKGVTVTQYIRALADEEISVAIRDANGGALRVERHTRAKALAIRLYDLALKADAKSAAKYFEILLDRNEGKVAEQIEIRSPFDLSKLSKEDLETLKRIKEKASVT